MECDEVHGDPCGGGGNKQTSQVQASVGVQMHLRKVFTLRRRRRLGNGNEEEKVLHFEEEHAEKEPQSSNAEGTSGDTDPEFLPDGDELQSNDSSFSSASESVTCSGADNPDAGAFAVHDSEEGAAADIENLIGKEVYHTRLLTDDLKT